MWVQLSRVAPILSAENRAAWDGFDRSAVRPDLSVEGHAGPRIARRSEALIQRQPAFAKRGPCASDPLRTSGSGGNQFP